MAHLISAAGVVLASAACMVVLAWGTGRVVSDRFLWTQYLAWIPTVLAAPAAFMLLVASSAVGLLDEGTDKLTPFGKKQRRRRRRIATSLRIAGWAGFVWMAWGLLATDLNLGASRRTAVGPVGSVRGPMTLVYWNLAHWEVERAIDLVRVHKPDLAIVANAGYDVDRRALRERIAAEHGREVELLEAGSFAIVSVRPIVAWGVTSLGFKGTKFGSEGTAPPLRVDPGRALWLAIDVERQDGRPLVVWVMDLPSDPSLSRRKIAESTRRQLLTWQGTIFRRSDEPGRWSPDTSMTSMGFPEPDIIVGDFNIPRGSWSLGVLASGPDWSATNAFDQGGVGYAATWPLRTPLWHIDQTFLAPWLRASSYRVVNPRAGLHWMQVVKFGSREMQ